MRASSLSKSRAKNGTARANGLVALAALRVRGHDPNAALAEIAAATASLFRVPSVWIMVNLNPMQQYQGQFGLPEEFSFEKMISEPAPAVPPPAGPDPLDSPTAEELARAGSNGRRSLPANGHRPGDLVPDTPAPEEAEGTTEEVSEAPLQSEAESCFYAGVPIMGQEGEALGMLCLMDRVPRHFSPQEVDILRALAARALDEVEMRADRERNEHERQHLEQISRGKTEMVAWTAHEIKTPLTVIKGISSLLASDPKLALEMRVDFLHTITQQAERALRLMDEALELASLESGRTIPLNIQDVDLGSLLVDLCRVFDATSSQHQVLLEQDGGAYRVWGDSEKLEQIFTNLLENAIKFSPDGGEVRVRATTNRETVEVAVQDQGLGLAREQISQLFGRFTRFHTEVAPRIKGSGLGLYLTRHLVEAHQGTIRVESQPGVGSTFTVRLPRTC